jgi:hypothetical protein
VYCALDSRAKNFFRELKDPLFGWVDADFSDFTTLKVAFDEVMDKLEERLDPVYYPYIRALVSKVEDEQDLVNAAIVLNALWNQGYAVLDSSTEESCLRWGKEAVGGFVHHLNEEDISDRTRELATAVISSMQLFGLNESDPVIFALLPMTIDEQGLPIGPIGITKRAIELRKEVTRLQEEKKALNPTATRIYVSSRYVKRESIPQELTAALWGEMKEALYQTVTNQTDLRDIRKNFDEDPFITNILGRTEERLTADEILFWSALRYFHSLSLEDRNQALFELGLALMDCEEGKSQKLELYVSKRVSKDLWLTSVMDVDRRRPEGVRPLQFLTHEVQNYYASFFTIGVPLLHEATGVKLGREIAQWPHSVRYLRNVFDITPVQFDVGGDAVNRSLLAKSAEELQEIAARHMTVEGLALYVQKSFNTRPLA